MRTIYDIRDLRLLDKTELANELSNNTIITATTELAKYMRGYYVDYHVYDVHKVIKAVFPEWEKQAKNVRNYINLRNVLEDYIFDESISDITATCLQRNATDIWNAILILIEAGITPEDFPETNSELIGIFKNIWNLLEAESTDIISYRKIYAKYEKDTEFLDNRLKVQVKFLTRKIFMIGFYYITPIQMQIIDLMEHNGYEFIYLNLHDSAYSFACEIWEKTFEQEYKSGCVKKLQPDIKKDNCFGSALEGMKIASDINLVKHFSPFEFAQDVKEAKKRGALLYTPSVSRCDKILREFYPEFYNDKHLLSYPVGQYIYNLHMMWNNLSGKLELKFEWVYKCFASGWLEADLVNGRDYLYELKKIEPFFKNALTIEEWDNKLKDIEKAHDVVSCFDEREKGDERWHKLMGNPFHKLGIYEVELAKLKEIIELMRKLMSDAEELFGNKGKVDLYNHLEKIRKIVSRHRDEELFESEKEVVKELLVQLEDKNNEGIECPLNSVRDAIVLLIGDHLETYESYEIETNGENHMIQSLAMVESSVLAKDVNEIYLAMGDEYSLPGKPQKLPWPLTDEIIDLIADNLLENSKSEKANYLKALRDIVNNKPLSNRYLFYSLMDNYSDNTKITIEWIAIQDKKEIEITPYSKLLNNIADATVRMSERVDWSGIMNKLTEEKKSVSIDDFVIDKKGLPEEVILDYSLCKLRYLYSYVLNYLPTYVDEFHYSFALTKLIEVFTSISGRRKEEIAKHLYELFPFFRTVEEHQIIDFASKDNLPDPSMFEDIEYPGLRLGYHFLSDKVLSEAYKSMDDESGIMPKKDKCMYCPYSSVCLVRYKEGVATIG